MNDLDRKEMEEMAGMVVEMIDSVIDKMIENGSPTKIAKLARAYKDAFIEEGFSAQDAQKMIEAVLRSQSFNTKSS